jgi:hypothetical protein
MESTHETCMWYGVTNEAISGLVEGWHEASKAAGAAELCSQPTDQPHHQPSAAAWHAQLGRCANTASGQEAQSISSVKVAARIAALTKLRSLHVTPSICRRTAHAGNALGTDASAG